MKKVYINPETTTVIIEQTQQIMAGSTSIPLGGSGSANDAEGRDNASDLWEE